MNANEMYQRTINGAVEEIENLIIKKADSGQTSIDMFEYDNILFDNLVIEALEKKGFDIRGTEIYWGK